MGEDFDNKVVEWCVQEFERKNKNIKALGVWISVQVTNYNNNEDYSLEC